MIRVLAVAALLGCACAKPSPKVAAPPASTCATCPERAAVPPVELTLCPVERPAAQVCTAQPERDWSILRQGSGFWCMGFLDGKWAGKGDCFRYREPCEEWRRRFRKFYKTSECRPAERASCVQVTDYKRLFLFYQCFPAAQCEATRATQASEHPDLVYSECRETD